MDERTRAILGRVLLASAILLAALGGASLGGWLPVGESTRSVLAICLFVVAAADAMTALFFLTRS